MARTTNPNRCSAGGGLAKLAVARRVQRRVGRHAVSHIDYFMAQEPRVGTPESTPPRPVAELRLTQDRRDTTIGVAERMYTMGSLDRFRGFNRPGEHQCARNDLLEENS